jgi:hypothetical protein
MDEDIELLRSMYVEGKELTMNHHINITTITFFLSNLISIDEDMCLVIDILSDHVLVGDVKLRYGNKSVSLNSDLLGIDFTDSVPSEILTHVIDNISVLKGSVQSISQSEEMSNLKSASELWRIVYTLDHMRNENKYRKCLAKFAKQTDCYCMLYYGKQGIKIIVEGERTSVKEFVKLNKTSTVDVDSTGRSRRF